MMSKNQSQYCILGPNASSGSISTISFIQLPFIPLVYGNDISTDFMPIDSPNYRIVFPRRLKTVTNDVQPLTERLDCPTPPSPIT